MHISAQVSLFPLRQDHLSLAIREMQGVRTAAGLDVARGCMSTSVTDEDRVKC